MQKKSVSQIAKEAENFAANEYLPAMLRIDSLTAQEKENLLEKFSSYTGLSKTFIDQNNFRIELDKRLVAAEPRHGHVDDFSFRQGPLSDRALG